MSSSISPSAETAEPLSPQPADAYLRVRRWSETLAEPLAAEDCVVQSMPDVSPTRWHLAHTTWFFETFVLKQALADYQPVDEAFEHLFNSYYNSVGEQFERHRRGLLSRPTVAEVMEYRRAIDDAMRNLLESGDCPPELLAVVQLGLHHEQQHQELMLTDIKHVFSCNPLFPAYCEEPLPPAPPARPLQFVRFDEGVKAIGHDGDGFAFDNESPRHRVFLESFELADRLAVNGEYLQFIEDGGYQRPEFWLSLGWSVVEENGWRAPLYWIERDGRWFEFDLRGLAPLDPHRPVCHLSYFEADAFARWSGRRLPTEAEWETAAENLPVEGSFADSGRFHPAADTGEGALRQAFGELWQWTASPYAAYPGYQPPAGALGEYNGKFMCNQYVLRGGSCATPAGHVRPTYRNFFPPEARWQFSGIRLAR